MRVERVGAPRRGYVWVAGYWDWRNGRYQWTRGHYERSKAGKRWRQPQWEEREGAWVRVNGDWDTAPQYPDQAPPEPREERVRQRRGYVYIRGRWDWQDGQWNWTAGRYEREKAGAQWNDGRWEQRDNRWQYTDGRWDDGSSNGGGQKWAFDSRGWTLLGEKTVEGRNRDDSAQVDFSQKQGKVNNLTLVVLDSDLEMIDLTVQYVSGKQTHPTDKQYFREGSRTRMIRLEPNEILRVVLFKYRNVPGGAKARVQVWGDVVK
jgi:hypothetical protein